MSSGTRILVKILVAVVSYGVTLALAFYAISQFFNGNADTLSVAWIILVIIAICGFIATKNLPFFYATGGASGQGFAYTMIFLALRILLTVFIGAFVAPWMIAKKLVSLIPGE